MLLLVLLAAAPALATPKATPIDPDQKVRCMRQDVTGSLVAGPNVCHTVAEWRKQAERAQSDAMRIEEAGRICPSCQGR